MASKSNMAATVKCQLIKNIMSLRSGEAREIATPELIMNNRAHD